MNRRVLAVTSLATATGAVIALAMSGRAVAQRPDTGSGQTTGQGAAGAGASPSSAAGSRVGASSAGPAASGAAADPSVANRAAEEWLTVPTGWRPLAEMALAPPPGSGAVRVESRRAYGDPASGCFALLQRASAPVRGFDLAHVSAAFVRELEVAGFTAGPAGASMPFAGRGVRGRVRTITAGAAPERVAVLSVACFYNDREPDRCRPTCDAMLDSAGAER